MSRGLTVSASLDVISWPSSYSRSCPGAVTSPPLTVTATWIQVFASSDTGAAAVCTAGLAPGPAIDAWCGVVPDPGVAVSEPPLSAVRPNANTGPCVVLESRTS